MVVIPRPAVFVGSSAEGLPVVEAIAVNLEHCCEVVPWPTVFGTSEYSLESLETRLDRFDFAILVMTADDITKSRGTVSLAARDNVLLELGIFIGALGRRRTMIVADRSVEIKIPSDLAGINSADFIPPSSGNYCSALSAACFRMKEVIGSLGFRKRLAV